MAKLPRWNGVSQPLTPVSNSNDSTRQFLSDKLLVITSLLIGLLIGTVSLINYNATIDRLMDRGIASLARAHYLMPVVTVILGLVVGFAIWFYLRANSIPFFRDDYRKFALVAIVIGLISLYVSMKVESVIFRGKA